MTHHWLHIDEEHRLDDDALRQLRDLRSQGVIVITTARPTLRTRLRRALVGLALSWRN